MRPKRFTVTGAGSSPVYFVNHYAKDPTIAVGVKVDGVVNYTVQHTFDDVQALGFDASTATWYSHETLVAQTANADGKYTALPTGIRLTVNSGAGSATMTLVPTSR